MPRRGRISCHARNDPQGAGSPPPAGRRWRRGRATGRRAPGRRLAGPCPAGWVPVHPRGRLRRSRSRRGRAVDPTGPSAAARRWRDGGSGGAGRLAGRGRAGPGADRPQRHRPRPARPGPHRARGGGRAGAGPHLVVSVPGRRGAQPGRPDPDPARARSVAGAAGPGGGLLPALRARLLQRLPAPGPGGPGPGAAPGRLPVRDRASRGPATTAHHAGPDGSGRLPPAPRPVPHRPQPAGGPCGHAVRADLGRPRGRQRLRRRPVRALRPAGGVSPAPGRRLPGLLGASAPAAPQPPPRVGGAAVPPPAVR